MKAFNKDIVRSIRHSLGRFVAIAAIVALGCGFYAGLRMTAPDMKLAADAYYDGTDLMDIRVVSTLGLTDEDIEALRDVPGVSGVEAAYSADVLATLNDEQYVMRVHSLSPSAATGGEDGRGAPSPPMTRIISTGSICGRPLAHLGQRVRHLQRPRHERSLLAGGYGDG